jgi:hypothetical protein
MSKGGEEKCVEEAYQYQRRENGPVAKEESDATESGSVSAKMAKNQRGVGREENRHAWRKAGRENQKRKSLK